MPKIYLTTWTFSKGEKKNKRTITIPGVIVTGNCTDTLKESDYYKRRALYGVKIIDKINEYTVTKIEIVKEIGTETNY